MAFSREDLLCTATGKFGMGPLKCRDMASAQFRGIRHQLTEMRKTIDAEKSDRFDVRAHVACRLEPLSRE